MVQCYSKISEGKKMLARITDFLEVLNGFPRIESPSARH